MLCKGVLGLYRKHAPIKRLGAGAVAFLVQRERLFELFELLNVKITRHVRASVSSERTVTVLEALATAARTGIIATHGRDRRRLHRRRGVSMQHRVTSGSSRIWAARGVDAGGAQRPADAAAGRQLQG